MDYRQVFAVSAAGMDLERRRLEVAALNLANMNAPLSPTGEGFKPQRVVAGALRFSEVAEAVQAGWEGSALRAMETLPMNVAPRLAHEPGHPMADAQGMVRYPAVNHSQEMVTVLSALRAYEANVAVATVGRAMTLKAMDIGGGA